MTEARAERAWCAGVRVCCGGGEGGRRSRYTGSPSVSSWAAGSRGPVLGGWLIKPLGVWAGELAAWGVGCAGDAAGGGKHRQLGPG